MRIATSAIIAVITAWPATGLGLDKTPPAAADVDPDEGIARPSADDLRTGHFIIGLGGGLWAPSAGVAPELPPGAGLEVGGGVNVSLGLGVHRMVLLKLEGGYAHAATSDPACTDCSLDTFDVGLAAAFHPTQGFAFDPWASFGVGYRHLAIGALGAEHAIGALEPLRLSLGGDYFPLSSLGFGPYLSASVGLRDLEAPTSYASFTAGLRLIYDPARSGISFSPGVASAR